MMFGVRLRKREAPYQMHQRFKVGGRHQDGFCQENAPAAFFNELLMERESQAQATAQDRVHTWTGATRPTYNRENCVGIVGPALFLGGRRP
jgi:hypothetical protein